MYMGFLNILRKGADILADFENRQANKIDRMSDDEIKKQYSEPVDVVRARAEQYHSLYEQWQSHRIDEDDD